VRRGEHDGATVVEYAVMVGLIAAVILGAVQALGQSVWTDDTVEVLGRALTGSPEAPVEIPPGTPDEDRCNAPAHAPAHGCRP